MTEHPFALTPVEQTALEAIHEERPDILAVLRERFVPVLEELSRSCQGLLATELQVDDFLDRLRQEFTGRMMAETEPWGEDENLREAVVDLLTRHLLAEARDSVVKQVVGAKLN